jgi:hypothetical protein
MFHELLHLPSRKKGRRRRERNTGRGGGEGEVAVCCTLNVAVSYLNIWKYELLLDARPYDASHLVTVHLDYSILGHNPLSCI